MTELTGRRALVVGASRGLGRGIAVALDEAGARVVAVARDPAALAELAAARPAITSEPADAAREEAAAGLIGRHRPDILVLVAGAVPTGLPLPEHTWQTFSAHWDADVKIAFSWLKAALLAPLAPGSRIIVISSGAAVFGSPASGGYAGAKATQRFLAAYAAEESRRAGLGLTVTAVLPAMTPSGAVGRSGIRAYAARAGTTEDEFRAGMGEPLTPEEAGAAVAGLVAADPGSVAPGYLLAAGGLRELPAPALSD
ncbi:MAG TPA: SDR family oxidoreductase [Trebonia sp.]|jgi:NAD(P)-dependent dehydrogenase (short-subunit alcohol dehydrogenase family)|nr:SDR family oxidoreductase [Trebonia sp.]